jgi:hypothetical protein
MKILSVHTSEGNIRSEIWGWGEEDADLFVPEKPIGLTPGPLYYSNPKTVMEALYLGWKLLGPPTKYEGKGINEHYDWWDWWLVKE